MNPFNFYKYLPFIFRKTFKKKYIVIESDDWGMEGALNENGISFLKSKYGKHKLTRWTMDALETSEDLEILYELFLKYKHSFEESPVITTNFIMYNIDYSKKDKLSFISLSSYLKTNKVTQQLYDYGIKNNIISPQLHGYSHFDVRKLSEYFNTKEGEKLFNNGFLAGKSTIKGYKHIFHSELNQIHNYTKKYFQLAINEFKLVFGYKPISLIPPHFLLDKEIIPLLTRKGIISIQASNRLLDSRKNRYRKIYFRKNNRIIWIPRNARLDPYEGYNFHSENCLEDIKRAFDSKVPAIIDFHRVNISGRYNLKYREKSLNELDKVFQAVLEKWPDTQFITTEKLIKLCQA